MKSIAWLEDLGSKDVSVAGGKGAQLGELKKAGFNVPDGFAVTVNVYKYLISLASKEIRNILSKLDVENTNALEEASAKIQSLIVSAELPEKTGKEILEAYRNLGGLVAVRSSATSEDMEDASFAGQLSTFLNVSEDKLLESVKMCMASLFTARAICYRSQKKIDHMKASAAVVVQRMAGSKKSGVAFSVNPVNNNEKEIVIEAAIGLGEAVVGGQIIPDNYVVNKETAKAKESNIRSDFPVLS